MAAVRQVRQMQEVVDRMNLQIYRVGGLKILGATLPLRCPIPLRGIVGADQIL